MPDAAGVAALLTLSPAVPDAPGLDLDTVTPGPAGFIATFAVVIVVVFLLRDFSRRVRRLKLRGEATEREAREAREAAAGVRADTAGPAPRAPGVMGGTPDSGPGPGQDPPVGRQRPDGSAPLP